MLLIKLLRSGLNKVLLVLLTSIVWNLLLLLRKLLIESLWLRLLSWGIRIQTILRACCLLAILLLRVNVRKGSHQVRWHATLILLLRNDSLLMIVHLCLTLILWYRLLIMITLGSKRLLLMILLWLIIIVNH